MNHLRKRIKNKIRTIKKNYLLNNEPNKIVFFLSLIICIVTLVLSIVFYCNECSCVQNKSIVSSCKGIDYGKDMCIGIFASSFLVMIVALINYLSNRRETLEGFFDSVMTMSKRINMYDLDADLEYKNNYLLETYRNYFNELDRYYSRIARVLKKKDRDYVYYSLYHPINLIREQIGYYNQEMVRYQNRKEMDIGPVIKEIENYFLPRNKNNDNDEIIVGISNKTLAYEWVKELTGRYYKLMYFKSLEDDLEYYMDDNQE